jgi:hypothetical protein
MGFVIDEHARKHCVNERPCSDISTGFGCRMSPLFSALYGKIARRSVVPFAPIPTALKRSHFSARKGLKIK